jgi:hypothetical protein
MTGWFVLYQPVFPDMPSYQRPPGWYLVPESFLGYPDPSSSIGIYPTRKSALVAADRDRMVVINR